MKKFLKPPVLISCLVFCIILLGTLNIFWINYKSIEKVQQELAAKTLSEIKASLEEVFYKHFYLILSLEAFAKSHLSENVKEKDFEILFTSFADYLHHEVKGILSLQLAPKGIVTYVSNINRNRKALNHDLFKDDIQRLQILETVKHYPVVVNGPLKLIQGGSAIIARKVIFSDTDAFDPKDAYNSNRATEKETWPMDIPSNFWGFATVLMDTETLYDEAGLNHLSKDYKYSLRGRHGLGEKGEIFWGDATVFDNPYMTTEIKLSNGKWILGIQRANTDINYRLIGIPIAGFIFALTSSLLIYISFENQNLKQDQQHRKELETKTVSLEKALENQRQSEELLRDSKERFERLGHRLKDKLVFFSHTLQGEILTISEGFNLLGSAISSEKAIGLSWPDCISWTQESIAIGKEHHQKLTTDPTYSASIELIFTHSDGTLHYLDVYEYSIYNKEKNRNVIEGVALDITEQKRQDEQLRIFKRAIENAFASIVITETDGTIKYVNPAFTKITGYSQEEAIGANPRILKSGMHDENFYNEMWKILKKGNTWHGEISNKKKNGSIFWELASISPILDNDARTICYVAVKSNITEQKDMERLKEDVDRMMRHDLKQPLNAIIGLPQILKCDSNLTDEQIGIINDIEEVGYNMLNMIELSLDMFKMETGKYQYMPQKVNAIRVIVKIIEHSGTRLCEKQIKCQFLVNGNEPLQNESLIVWSQERLLYSLLSNLFANAVEASPPHETVLIEINDTDPICIAISNKGAVPKAIRNYFFDKYITFGKSKGTGLGTYSAKLLANAMNYKIEMQTSDKENSTCVSIHIPVGAENFLPLQTTALF